MALLTISNLPPKMTREKLEELFSPFGGTVIKFDNTNVWNISAKLEVPDINAEDAFKATNKKKIDGKELKVTGNIPQKPAATPAPKIKAAQAPTTLDKSVSPYRFAYRPNAGKKEPTAFHDSLCGDRFDIAFEVTWRSQTPIAANPCNDVSVDSTCPSNNEGKNQGFDKRWLMIDNRLAISPFTVKSAIANGFASLMGGCFHVTDRIEKHPDRPDPEKFNYNGAFKRYRVIMGNSKPGILESIDFETGDVVIQKVTEYFYDSPAPPTGVTFTPGNEYFCCPRNNRHKPTITADTIFAERQANSVEVKYFDRYRFGMNLTFGPGEFNKGHHHRFYSPTGIVTGKVSSINLQSLKEQRDKIYMGVFKKLDQTARFDKRSGLEGAEWHQELSKLKKGDWVYYQEFGGKVAAIGLNFQFKTVYEHSDAVPDDQKACTEIQKLCPRCSLFGIADDSKNKDRIANGFKGRFKAGALVNNLHLNTGSIKAMVPTGDGTHLNADFTTLNTADGEEIARQFLLPIMGAPKPNKRDVTGGYYDKGMIRGAKQYLHSGHTMETFKTFIDRVNGWKTLRDVHGTGDMPYSHDLRSYGMVCKEKLAFNGTVGIENCSASEAAALVILLQQNIADQGFKIGLGKSLGLGSIVSNIQKIWIRTAKDYQWETVEVAGGKLIESLDSKISGLRDTVEGLKKAQEKLGEMQRREPVSNRKGRKLEFPAPGHNYWEDFRTNLG